MEEVSNEAKVKAMTIFYLPLIFIPTAAAITLLYISSSGGFEPEAPHLVGTYWITVFVIAPAGFVVGLISYMKSFAKINADSTTVAINLNLLRKSLIVRSVCTELPMWFGVICAYKTGDMRFLIVTVVFLIVSLFMETTILISILKSLAQKDPSKDFGLNEK